MLQRMEAFMSATNSFLFFILFEMVMSANEKQQAVWEKNHRYSWMNFGKYIYWPQVDPAVHCPLFLYKFAISSQISGSTGTHFFKDEINDSGIIRYNNVNGFPVPPMEVCRVICECHNDKYYFIKIMPSGCIGRAEFTNEKLDGKELGNIVDVRCFDEFKELYSEQKEHQIPWEFASPTPIGIFSSGTEEQRKKWAKHLGLAYIKSGWLFVVWREIQPQNHCPLILVKFGILREVTFDILEKANFVKNENDFWIKDGRSCSEVRCVICNVGAEIGTHHFIKTWPPGCIARVEILQKLQNNADYAEIVDVKCDKEFMELFKFHF